MSAPTTPAASPPGFIEWRGIAKRFGDKEVLRDFSLRVAQGEILYLMGTSGAGKSVAIRMLVGLLRPDAGELWFDGQALAGASEATFLHVRQRLAMVLQASGLLSSLTLRQNIALPLARHHAMTMEAALAYAGERLGEVDLAGFADRLPGEVSDGIRKRAAIVRAFALRPVAVLLDEPTTSLDPLSARGVDALLRHLAKKTGLTAVVVSHDLVSAATVADRIALLYDKRVYATLAAAELATHLDPLVRQFFDGNVSGPMETPGF